MSLNNSQAIDLFVVEFPEYIRDLDELLSWWSPSDEDSGLYTFFGQIIDPLVFRPMLTEGVIDAEFAFRFFYYLEELLVAGDQRVRECVKDEIAEQLASHSEWHEKVRPFIGARLDQMYRALK